LSQVSEAERLSDKEVLHRVESLLKSRVFVHPTYTGNTNAGHDSVNVVAAVCKKNIYMSRNHGVDFVLKKY